SPSRLSTSDTTASSTRVSRGDSVISHSVQNSVGRASVGRQPEARVEDVASDVGGAAAGGVGMGAQAHQGHGGFDAELGDQHAGGLADLDAGQGGKIGPGIAVRIVDGDGKR